MEIQNKKLDEGVFMQERQEVLGQWPTGKDVDLQEAADYQKRLSPERVFSTKLLEAKKAGRTLIQPRAGVPVIEEHIKLMQYLEKARPTFCPPRSTATPGKTAMPKRRTAFRNPSGSGAPCSMAFPRSITASPAAGA